MSSPEIPPAPAYEYFGPKYYEKYKNDPAMLEFAKRTNRVINDFLRDKQIADPSELSSDEQYELEQTLASKVWKFGGGDA